MLVCFVSARPRGSEIAAQIAEAAEAIDELTGGIVFSALVDDPASAFDSVDAFLGDIMVEAASAADDLSAGSIFADAVDEATVAADTQDATVTGAAATRQAMVAGPNPV